MPSPTTEATASAAHAVDQVRRGIGVSPGFGVGPVVQVAPPVRPPVQEPAAADPAAAAETVRAALDAVAADLDDRASRAEAEAAQVLGAGAMIARDKELFKAIVGSLEAGSGPATAIDQAVETFAERFTAIGGYFAERVADLRDVGARAIAIVLGEPMPGVPALTEPSILVAHDLAPAETASLDRAMVAGIVTQAGGRTSHTAILAAQYGIPAAVQVADASAIAPATRVAVDGSSGQVWIDPSDEVVTEARERLEKRAELLASTSGPGSTADGHAVKLLANIGGPADAEAAAVLDLEGVGLFRTEFVFLTATSAPTREEQAAIYRRVFAPFGSRRVVVRTLDAGADKPLAFADLGEEENPALGRRGLRLSQALPELLDTQLQAIADAAQATEADVWVMAPMVATADEAAWFASRVAEAGLPMAGVMIEIPAAAINSHHVLAEVGFGSLGTNDLAQYTMGADRMQGELSDLLDPWQPAVLGMVAQASDGARENDRPLGVCGESAGDPALALVLAGLGVTSLSMAPGKVAAVRASLALHTVAECKALASVALSARTAKDARELVVAHASPELAALL